MIGFRSLVRALALCLTCAMPAAAPFAATATDLSDLVPSLLPSVVNISMWHYEPNLDANGKPLADGSHHRKTGVGTGYIVDSSGIILTNRHVTDGAQEIDVTLYDGTRLRAALMYRAPGLDMAVLRVRPNKPLPRVKWGDSDLMQPGKPVIAIGNPIGLGFTVTQGIVSARDRNIKETEVDSFMQVDAAINPGNSGGPLFNLDGEVIGMNTALFSVGGLGGSNGLNMAIPANDVKFVVAHLVKYGRVRAGVVGVISQDLNQDMADAVGLARPDGVVLSYVVPGSTAEAAGLRAGDIVQKVGSTPIANGRGLIRAVGVAEIGATEPFLIYRDGETLTLPVKIAEKPADPANKLLLDATPAPRVIEPDLGLAVEVITDAGRQAHGIPPGVNGVVVTDVRVNTVAADLGIAKGYVIVRINGAEITSMAGVRQAVTAARAAGRQFMMMLIMDTTGMHWMAVPVPPPA